ncbi:hypothetical protein RR48_06335 [Papilio machaon]|uniref:Gem-associated protein 5 TPR domain-containing protein n=1 Tax=Papilio machaon TaxID=76193 RepID=A0A194R3X5_PAPMA|nr:hypothetical protein RR48_06335 [Papilio machaon]
MTARLKVSNLTINGLLLTEVEFNGMDYHLSVGNLESWIMLSVLRGRIDCAVQFAVQRDMLCPYLLSLTPCVSHKYWKEVMQLYISQLDRLVAKGEEDKHNCNHLAMGDLSQAATFMGKSNESDFLCLAAEMAKLTGQTTFADHIVERKSNIMLKEKPVIENEDSLGELPTRMELLLKEETSTKKGEIKEKESIEQSEMDLPSRMEQLLRDVNVQKEELNGTEVKTESQADGDMEKLPSKMELLLREYASCFTR